MSTPKTAPITLRPDEAAPVTITFPSHPDVTCQPGEPVQVPYRAAQHLVHNDPRFTSSQDLLPEPQPGTEGWGENLSRLTREELNQRASDRGVPDPDQLANKQAVIDAIAAADHGDQPDQPDQGD
jgi:hypothetical protein